jgi:hypothetical protein
MSYKKGLIGKIVEYILKADKAISGIINAAAAKIFGEKTYAYPEAGGKKLADISFIVSVICLCCIMAAGANAYYIVLLSVLLISIISPVCGMCMMFMLVVFDSRADIQCGMTVYSNEAMLIVIVAGAIIHLLIYGWDMKKTYPGVSISFAFMVCYMIPLFFMPEKETIIKSIIKGCEIFAVYFYIVMFFHKKSDIKVGMLFITSGILAVVMLSLREFIFHRENVDFMMGSGGMKIYRIGSIIGVTAFPEYLNIVLPAAFFTMIFYRKNTVLFFVSSLSAALGITAILVFPFSRTGWTVLIFSIIIVAFFIFIKGMAGKNFTRGFVVILACSFFISASFMYCVYGNKAFEALSYRITSSMEKGTASNKSATNRLKYFQAGCKLLSENFAGIGAGNLKNRISVYMDNTVTDKAYLQHIHNMFLQIAVESGFFGLVAVIFMFFFTFVIIAWLITGNDVFGIYLGITTAASCSALIISGISNVPFIFSRGIFTVFIIGLFMAYFSENV